MPLVVNVLETLDMTILERDEHAADVEIFKEDNIKGRFSSIMVAGTILGGIELRNIWRDNGKLEGEKEIFPYNEEQIRMIDKYDRLQETLDKIEHYAEYILEDEEELE